MPFLTHRDARRASDKNYYYVVVYNRETGAVEAYSEAKQVEGNYELQNGCFEDQDQEGRLPMGTNKLAWKTTGKVNGEADNIEIVAARDDNTGEGEGLDQWYGVTNTADAAEGHKYFAELNCAKAGTLYQEVLTAPGQTVNWALSHATRRNEAGLASKNGSNTYYERLKNDNKFFDTMYLMIVPTKLIKNEHLTIGQKTYDLTDQNSLLELESDKEADEVNAYSQVYLKIIDTDTYYDENGNRAGWYNHKGSYIAPEGVYSVRYFFVSGKTAWDKLADYRAKITDTDGEGSVGNLLDNIYFTTNEVVIDESAEIRIQKKITGLSETDKNLLQNYKVRLSVKEVGSGSTPDQRAVEIKEFEWNAGQSCFIGYSDEISVDGGRTYEIEETTTIPGTDFENKYTWTKNGSTTTATVTTTASSEAQTVKLENAYKEKTTNITVTKTWEDRSSDSTAPNNVQAVIGLYQKVGDGKETAVTETKDEQPTPVQWTTKKSNAVDGSATYTFENLPLTDGSGNNITYSVKEEKIQKVANGTATDLTKAAGTENYIYVGSSDNSTTAGYWTAGTPTQDSTTDVWSITNTWTDASPRSFTIQKKLKGNAAVAGTEFSFILDLSEMDATKLALFKELNKEALGNQYNSLELDRTTSTNANVEFKLKPEKTMEEDSNAVVSVTYQIPAGVKVNVAETEISGYKTYIDSNATAANVVSGKIVAYSEAKALTGNSTVLFTNEYNINPTGVRTSRTAGMMAIFMGLGLMGLMSAGYVVVRRKRW